MRMGKRTVDVAFFLLALLGVSFGVGFLVRAGFGISVASSLPYLLSLRFASLSQGVWSYIVQGCTMAVMMVVLRRARAVYLLSFLSSVASGYIIDLANWLLGLLPPLHFVMRLAFFAIGVLLFCSGVAFSMLTSGPVMPFDLFLREVSAAKGIGVRRLKTGMDIAFLIAGVSLSLLFFGGFVGVGLGTLVCAGVNGSLIGLLRARLLAVRNRLVGEADGVR